MKDKILLVEDDENLGLVTKDFLEMANYEVTLTTNGHMGLELFAENNYDMVILDVMLPQVDGFSVAEKIRKSNKDIPLIFLTARSMKEDRIKGFNLGADDYITKPFSTEELRLRVDAILRRVKSGLNKPKEMAIYTIGPFTFNYDEYELSSPVLGKKRLTKREADVLRMLCHYKNKTLKREVALNEIWGENDYFMGRSMDVYITKLRKLLKAEPGVTISNVHNIGFKLQVDE
ncbi:MAG: response regulator transcription factor [Bacteroidota bacterium]|nr:MAG: response regulator transcription factor [Bacteroidota bacterium]